MIGFLAGFVAESNRIEGIHREPTSSELDASSAFLALPIVSVTHLEVFVHVCEPTAELRVRLGMNVRVGDHYPPLGGPQMRDVLATLVAQANEGREHPYITHHAYETLHPFTDGNGRSGRILWAWQMLRQGRWPGIRLGFLHAWYYQSLQFGRTGSERGTSGSTEVL